MNRNGASLKRDVDFSTFLRILLGIIFVSQVLVLLYFNLFHMKDHIGYDSSWFYLKPHLILNEKSLFVGPWVEQTSPFLDTPLLLATLIYGLTKSIFVSYAIADFIVLISVIMCVNSILKDMNVGTTSRLFAFNLIVLPYLSNGYNVDVPDYMDVFLVGAASYSVRVLLALMIIKALIVIRNTGRINWIGWAAVLLCVVAGLSTGVFMVVVIIFPCLVYELLLVFKRNDLRILLKKESIYIYLLSAAILVGMVMSKLLGIQVWKGPHALVPLVSLADNIFAPLLGLMKLIGVLPINDTDVQIDSMYGLLFVFPMFIFFVIVLGLAYAVKVVRSGKDNNHIVSFFLTVIAVNYLLFSVLNFVYGSYIFEERYQITTFMIIILLVAYYLDNADLKQLFSKTIMIGLMISIMAYTTFSDVIYMGITSDVSNLEGIIDLVNEEDAELIYVWGDDLMALERPLRFYDMDHVYKSIRDEGTYYHFGDYTYYEDNEDYSGPTLLIVSNDRNVVPEDVMEQYVLIHQLGSVSMYRSDTNPIYAACEGA